MTVFAIVLAILGQDKTYAVYNNQFRAQGFAVAGAGFEADISSQNEPLNYGLVYSNNAFNAIASPDRLKSDFYDAGDNFILRTCGFPVKSNFIGIVRRILRGDNDSQGIVDIATSEGLATYTGLVDIPMKVGDGVITNDVIGRAGGRSSPNNICAVGVFLR